MHDDLRLFLNKAAQQPFNWGTHDCLLFLADWVREMRGFDPAARWRGAYETRRGAQRVLEYEGGFVSIVEKGMGARQHTEPTKGDIALVRAPEGLMGALVTGRFTVSLGYSGLIYRGPELSPIIAAWRV